MPKKITNFELRDADNSVVVRQGDNSLLHKDGKYYSSNDNGDWKELYVVDLDAAEEPTPEPEPTPDPDPDPVPDPAPTPTPPPSTSADINTRADLDAAIQAGGSYTVAGGDYGDLDIRSNGVTLVAHDPLNRPKLTRLKIKDRQNIILDGFHLKYDYKAGDHETTNKVLLQGSSAVTVQNCFIEGDVDANTGSPHGRGVLVIDCDDVTLEGNVVRTFWKCFAFNRGNRNIFRGNDIGGFRSDGLTISQVADMLIEDNYLHDRKTLPGSGDHGDMIQIQRSSPGGVNKLIIQNNFIDMNKGSLCQSIHAGYDKYGADPHVGLVITGNEIINAQANGINLDNAPGAVVRDNVLTPMDVSAPGVQIPKIHVKGPNPDVTNNTAGDVKVNGSPAPNNTVSLLDAATRRAIARARWSQFNYN